MSRTQARVKIYQLIYEKLMNTNCTYHTFENFINKENLKDREYIEKEYKSILNIWTQLVEVINYYTIEKYKDKIFEVDKALLIVAVYEILYDVAPYKVCINEIIEISKIYSTLDSAKFINGILSSVVEDKEYLLNNYKIYGSFLEKNAN